MNNSTGIVKANLTPRVLWIGDHQATEFAEAWDWCGVHTKRFHRETWASAISEPADRVTHVIATRRSRLPLDRQEYLQAIQIHPIARWANLLGSLCEGESRTGEPWLAVHQIYWHRWQSELIQWLGVDASETRAAAEAKELAARGLVGIVARDGQLSRAIQESLSKLGVRCVATAPGQLSSAGPWRHLIWDDSILNGEADWQALRNHLPEQNNAITHHWLSTSPRITTWMTLQQAGIQHLHSKPMNLQGLIDSLQEPVGLGSRAG